MREIGRSSFLLSEKFWRSIDSIVRLQFNKSISLVVFSVSIPYINNEFIIT